MDDLKKTIEKLSKDKAELYNRIQEKDDEINEIITNAGLVIADMTNDLRIVNVWGAISYIFEDQASSVTQGNNFVKLIYKLTKNTKERVADKEKSQDDIPDMENALLTFLDGKKDERTFEVVGQRDNGEIFLLNWKVRRTDKYPRNYLRITPSNAVIESAQEHYQRQLDAKEGNFKNMLAHAFDGVAWTDKRGKILFLNDNAKTHYLANASEVLKKASIENKFYREIFAHEDNETNNKRFSNIELAISTKKPIKFVIPYHDREVEYHAVPIIDSNKEYDGMIVYTRVSQAAPQSQTNQINSKFDPGKIAQTIKVLLDEKKELGERLKELENNQKWFMKKMADNQEMAKKYQDTIKKLYLYLENLPVPITILTLPSKQYEFVNKSFEQIQSISRAEVKGKTDIDIYPEEAAKIFYEKLKESVTQKTQIHFEYENYTVRQFVVFNDNSAPQHLIRIFLEKNNE